MSHTTDNQYPSPNHTRTFRPEAYKIYDLQFREQLTTVGLLGGLYGVLTVLSIISVYALLTRQSGRIRRSAVVLCFVILAFFTSTTLYMVTSILRYQADFLEVFFYSDRLIWSYSTEMASSGVQEPMVTERLFWVRELQSCTSATTLTLNVVLGDAIVCWRACVVWEKSRVVRVLCGLLLLATFVIGVANSTSSCLSFTVYEAGGTSGPNPPGTALYYALSLVTNLFATLLVAYKAWLLRRRLGEYIVAKVGGSQVEKLMTLLIESGVIYSVILAAVLAYQVCQFRYISLEDYYNPGPQPSISSAEGHVLRSISGTIINGALVPAIAIYPTIIIVIVALNRSHMERGLTQHLESLPTPRLPLPLTIDTVTVATSLRESWVHGRAEVPAKCEDDLEEVKSLTGGDSDLESEASDLDSDSEEIVEEGTLYGKPLQHA